jgi:hypothetical protein
MDLGAQTDSKFCGVCHRPAKAGCDLCGAHHQEIGEQGSFRLQVLTRRFHRRLEALTAAPCAVGKVLVQAARIQTPNRSCNPLDGQDALRFVAHSADSDPRGLLHALGGRETVINLIAKKPRDPFFCQFCYRPAAKKTRFCSDHHYVDQKKKYRAALRRQSDFLRHLAALELRGFLRQSDNIGVTGLNAHEIHAKLIVPPFEGSREHASLEAHYKLYPEAVRRVADMRYVAYQSAQVRYEPLLKLATIQEEIRQKTGKKPISLEQLADARRVSTTRIANILQIGGSVNLLEEPLLQWRPDNHYRSVLFDNPLFGKHEQKEQRRLHRWQHANGA